MEIKEKIQHIAEVLRNSGLAISMEEALEKAKNIITLGSNKEKELREIGRADEILKIEIQRKLTDIEGINTLEEKSLSELLKECAAEDKKSAEKDDAEE